jgi:hypothetical protein
MNPSTPSEDNVYFVSDDQKISVKYQTFIKHSKYAEAIKWDTNEDKIIPLPVVDGYTELQVGEHLNFLLFQLQADIPTLLNFDNPLLPEVKQVSGNLPNLKLYLIVSLKLDIDIFVNELIYTLKSYIPVEEEYENYMSIYLDILRPYRLDGLKRLATIILNHPQRFDNIFKVSSIVKKLLQNKELPCFDRCMLAFRFSLSAPEDVDPVTARQVYIATKHIVILPIIEDEIDLITATNAAVIESITTYDTALRIPLEESPNGGLFYFYVHDIDSQTRNINVGTVTLPSDDKTVSPPDNDGTVPSLSGGDVYTVQIEKDDLITVDQFKVYNSIGSQDTINVPILSNQRYHTAYEYNMNYHGRINEHTHLFLDQQEDTLYRQYLLSLGRLTDQEIAFLHKRLEIKKQLPLNTQIKDNKGPSHWSDKITGKSEEQLGYSFVNTHYDMFMSLINEEMIYYSSEEGKKIEDYRRDVRRDFFLNMNRYGGLVAVMTFYSVASISSTNKTIVLSRRLTPGCSRDVSSTLYHTPLIPKNRHVDRSLFNWRSSFPTYKYISSNIIHHDNSKVVFDVSTMTLSTGESQLEPNTLLIVSSTEFDGPLHFIEEHLLYLDTGFSDVVDPPWQTLSIVDPSTLSNIDDIKRGSDPAMAATKPLILAHPYMQPLFYIKTGINTAHDPNPYVWYAHFRGEGKNDAERTRFLQYPDCTIQDVERPYAADNEDDDVDEEDNEDDDVDEEDNEDDDVVTI